MKLLVSEDHIKNITGLEGYRLFSHQRRKKYIIKLILTLCEPVSTILDIGCTSDDISVELSARGYHLHAIDLEPEIESRKKLRKKISSKY